VEVALGARLRETEPGILLNEYIGEDGLTVLAHACQLGAEGIVSKKQLVPMRDLVTQRGCAGSCASSRDYAIAMPGRDSPVRGNNPGSRERRASGPGWRLCSPPDSAAPRSIPGDTGYVTRGEITCDNTCQCRAALLSKLETGHQPLAQSHDVKSTSLGGHSKSDSNRRF
jgi:hypothetical protein